MRPVRAPQRREVRKTAEFQSWRSTLTPEQGSAVDASLARIAAGGPTLGRPRVDVIHGSQLRKLKEARIARSVRVLFAFDSNRNPVALVGGDKAGKWNRWYPQQVRLAERLYRDHERSIGKEPRCQSQRAMGGVPPPSR